MSETIKAQPKCYFVTPKHASSFWGKYIYLYDKRGQLRLTSKALAFESKTFSLNIPIQHITEIKVGMFSKWAKPFGLTYISVQFFQDGEQKTIFLIPTESGFSPSWKTCKIIEDWIETFNQIDELSSRIELPLPQITPPTFIQLSLFFLLLVALNMAVLFLVMQILR